jgi:hypothetical protein
MLYHSVKRKTTQAHAKDEIGILQWKARGGRLRGLRRRLKARICAMCRKEEELWHILEYEGKKERREIHWARNMEFESNYRHAEVCVR